MERLIEESLSRIMRQAGRGDTDLKAAGDEAIGETASRQGTASGARGAQQWVARAHSFLVGPGQRVPLMGALRALVARIAEQWRRRHKLQAGASFEGLAPGRAAVK